MEKTGEQTASTGFKLSLITQRAFQKTQINQI